MGFRIGLALPSPWVGRLSKLGIEGSRRKGSGENTSPSSPIPGALPPLRCSLLLLQGCPDLPGGFLFSMHLTVSCRGAGSSAVAVEWEPCSVAERALAVLSPSSACLWLLSVECGEGEALSGARVLGDLRTGKSEPFWQRTNRQPVLPWHKSRGSWLYQPRCLGWFPSPFVETRFSHWIQVSCQLLPEPPFSLGALVPLWSLISSLCSHLIEPSALPSPPHPPTEGAFMGPTHPLVPVLTNLWPLI